MMILQETERNQSWKPIDGNNPKKALYVHWLCVHRDFEGQGLSRKMFEQAEKEAVKRGFSILRLDTYADELKLCILYESLGFKLVGTDRDRDRDHLTAFFQKETI